MENLKKPEVAISATTAATLIATIFYFNSRIKKLEKDVDELRNITIHIGSKVDEISKQTVKAENLAKSNSEIKAKQSAQNKKIIELKTSNKEIRETLGKVIDQINMVSDKKIKYPNYAYKKKKKYVESSDEENDSEKSEDDYDADEIIASKNAKRK